MPPKVVQEKVKKAVDDKTFGMKNKKGTKNQQFIQMIQKNVVNSAGPAGPSKKEIKERKEREKAEIDALFKPAVVHVKKKLVENEDGEEVDPKTIVCEFYKMGRCAKGNKCKFSHDVSLERKEAKIDLYSDRRDDTMDKWDEDTLRDVVDKKDAKRNGPQTEIVCKYFLEAIETKKYGYFWECPNGGDKCMYRHKLPPGFVLKSEAKKDEDAPIFTLEEIIETEREKIKNGTPVTLETFKAWKAKKEEEKKKKLEEEAKALENTKGSKNTKTSLKSMSGKALFEYNPDLFVDDDDAADAYERDEEDGFLIDEEEEQRKLREGANEGAAIGEDDDDDENGKQKGKVVVDQALFANEDDDDDDDDELD